MPRNQGGSGFRFVEWLGPGVDFDRETVNITASVEFDSKRLAGWRLDVMLRGKRGAIYVARLVLRPTGRQAPRGGITTTMLREIPVETITREARERLARDMRAGLAWASPALQDELRARARSFITTPRPGQAGRDDRDYLPFLTKYLEAWNAGLPPVKTVAKELGYSTKTIRNLLDQAVERDLIEGRVPGKAGFTLTKKARRLLDG